MYEIWEFGFKAIVLIAETAKTSGDGWLGVLTLVSLAALGISVMGWLYMPWIIRGAILDLKRAIKEDQR